jgi:hypothetical protein
MRASWNAAPRNIPIQSRMTRTPQAAQGGRVRLTHHVII